MEQKRKSPIFVVLAVIVLIITCLYNFITFYAVFSSFSELNYPLTAFLPVADAWYFLVAAILLLILAVKARRFEKVRGIGSFCIFFFILGVVFLILSPTINGFIQEKHVAFVKQADDVYAIKGIEYNIPHTWKTSSADDGYYHYPDFGDNTLLYVSSQRIDYEMKYVPEELYEFILDGLISGILKDRYGKEISRDIILDSDLGFPMLYAELKMEIENDLYNTMVYVIIEKETNTFYCFMYGSKDALNKTDTDSLDKVLNSIRLR